MVKDDDDHGAAHFGAVDIAVCGLDVEERLILELMRCFCLEYAEPYSEGAVRAYMRAQEVAGKSQGRLLASHVEELMRAVRCERSNDFNFGDPRCAKCARRIFPTELAVMALVRAARRNNGDQMELAAREVVEKESGSLATLLAGHALGALLVALGDRACAPRAGDKPHLISGGKSLH